MQTVNPKISIIVPVYKVEKFINRCLDSIIAQTFTDWECIIIDDGSPDNSGKICDEYAKKDSRFVVIHQENAGVSAARNAGLDVAHGDYVTFVDSDDWVESNFLEEQYNDIISGDYDVCICGFMGKGKTIEKELAVIEAKKLLFIDNGTGGFSFLRLINKSVITDTRYNTDISYLEDTDFFYRLYDNCKKIIWTNKPLYNYYENAESVTRQHGFTNQKRDMIETIDTLCKKEKDKKLKQVIYNSSIKLRIIECLNFIITSDIFLDEMFLALKAELKKRIVYIMFARKFSLKLKIIVLTICFVRNYNKSLLIGYLRNKRGY